MDERAVGGGGFSVAPGALGEASGRVSVVSGRVDQVVAAQECCLAAGVVGDPALAAALGEFDGAWTRLVSAAGHATAGLSRTLGEAAADYVGVDAAVMPAVGR